MTFWLVAGALAIAVALGLWRAVLTARGTRAGAEYDLDIYRDQLRELDRDAERGLIAPAEAERARVEISRRILDADRKRAGGEVVRSGGRVLLGVGIVAMVAGAIGVYALIGSPGYRDLPLQSRIAAIETARAARPDQAAAEAEAPPWPEPQVSPEFAEMIGELRRVMAERPDDPEGLRLLAQNEARLNRFAEARAAQAHLVELLGEDATGQDWIDLGEFSVLAAGGYVSPEAEEALSQGLIRQPRNGTARYYWGLMWAQQGRPDRALPVWESLLRDSAPDDPWVQPVMSQIEDVAALAGSRVDPDLLAPRDDGTQEMIEGMVSGLADRLANDGGPPEDWARLVTSLRVLGREDDARAVYDEALATFADDADAVALIEEAGAGLAGATE
ncbi:c-type cytochrome biogenesis protein CcmI [Rhodobacterales bacterium HKCCE2091]|nr:c-type cytochrome biogenesis protein CcmI [Rhodobacterales bacterium HKCCE2091]